MKIPVLEARRLQNQLIASLSKVDEAVRIAEGAFRNTYGDDLSDRSEPIRTLHKAFTKALNDRFLELERMGSMS